MIDLLAGFDPGLIHNGELDLLRATRHMPDDRMGIHYGICRALGVTRVRDGLPSHLPSMSRLAVAEAAGMRPIWDLCHFDPCEEREAIDQVGRVSLAAPGDVFNVCPMNEPSIVPMLTGGAFSQTWAEERALLYMRMLSDMHPNPVFHSVDVINGGGPRQFDATDRLVKTGRISIVGINYYPHDAHAPLGEILIEVSKRYGLPVMVSETSWHDGHPGQIARFPNIRGKADWLDHVVMESYAAERQGADVRGVCWYPFTDMPSWDEPSLVWSSGMIHQDLTLDFGLARHWSKV